MPSRSDSADTQRGQLLELLHRVFGHREFRAHQQEVCEAAASGRDVLLVMPTGAGKSLCYQLPAVARRGAGAGACLVVSPLIALMEDQAAKLAALGLRVGRVHSGMSREDARQACRDYLSGELDFLFIAPERMRVPGFPEMLAKRKPALVAIDEAHCISQWGHDFRPDYRTLGQHLAALRPAPVIALTATATPTVQQDIVRQLSLDDPAVFITGFRRTNLAVEVVELSKPQRAEFAAKLLEDQAARPAIVYAGSRKQAEELAGALGRRFPAAAYHAGLDAATRERVQRAFLGGELDVVVATIAFGMGVDKADVRTVVHVALPGSVEAYYQEIGRAGRDGKPSRTVLLHGFADRKMQEFFLEKNYPSVSELERVRKALGEEFEEIPALARRVRMDVESVDRAVEKLLAQGLAAIDMNGDVRAAEGAGDGRWQRGYEQQIAHRREQIDRMIAFAESSTCRMAALVRHFGDTTDTRPSCGMCDVCNPAAGNARPLTDDERGWAREILAALAGRSTSTTKLFTELTLTRERKEFDAVLEGLARAGLVSIVNDTFRASDGRDVTYRKVSATLEGRDADARALDTVWVRGAVEAPLTKGAARKVRRPAGAAREQAGPLDAAGEARFQKLREWRAAAAKAAGIPPFMVFGDAVLKGVAGARPRTLAELGGVSGVGPAKLERFGAEVLGVCRGEAGAVAAGSSGRSEGLAERREESRKRDSFELSASGFQPEVQAARAAMAPRKEGGSRDSSQMPVASSQSRPVAQAAVRVEVAVELTPAQQELERRLREWRMEEARSVGLPSFFILSDTVLRGIAAVGPRSVEELRAVRGVGGEKVEKFGAAVVEICRG